MFKQQFQLLGQEKFSILMPLLWVAYFLFRSNIDFLVKKILRNLRNFLTFFLNFQLGQNLHIFLVKKILRNLRKF